MASREHSLTAPVWKGREPELLPLCNASESDSANLDHVAELLMRTGVAATQARRRGRLQGLWGWGSGLGECLSQPHGTSLQTMAHAASLHAWGCRWACDGNACRCMSCYSAGDCCARTAQVSARSQGQALLVY